MEAIRVTPITEAMLVSSTIDEPAAGEALWVVDTDYAKGAPCIRAETHRVYVSLQDDNIGNVPESSPLSWVDQGPTVLWAPFDNLIDTLATGSSPVTYVFNPGIATAFGLRGLVGHTAQVSIVVGGDTVYDETFDLDGSYVGDDFDYMFAPFNQLTQIVRLGLAPNDGEWTVAISGPDTASVGVIAVGTTNYLGRLQYGAEWGFASLSGATGIDGFRMVRSEKTLSGQLVVDREDINRVTRAFADLDGVLAVYVGTPDDDLEPLTLFGVATEATGRIDSPKAAFFSFTARGL